MKIGVLGTGDVGRALATGFHGLGHDVMMGSRAGLHEAAARWVGEGTDRRSEGTLTAAAEHGQVVVLALRGTAAPGMAEDLKGVLAGKTVIDATNPLDFSDGFPPKLAISGNDSAGEAVQRAAPEAKVVKAFNTVPNALMVHPDLPDGPPTMFIAGDDADAKRQVAGFLGDLGWDVEDIGGIGSSRWLEAMCMAWVMSAATSGNGRSAFRLLRG